MSIRSSRPHSFNRYSRDGFQRLNKKGDATIDIPLHQVGPNAVLSNGGTEMAVSEKASNPALRHGPHHRPVHASHHHVKTVGYDGEENKVTAMGHVYKRFSSFSVVVRYIFYTVPVGLLIAVPIVIGATAAPTATIGDVRIVWFFTWLECCWVGLWASKILAHFLPAIFTSVCGVVSSGTRKYALVIKALDIPLSLAGWALVSLATFIPIMTRNPDTRAQTARLEAHGKTVTRPEWQHVVNQILAAAMISTLIYLIERLFIQLLSINYHRKQFSSRIKDSKHNIFLLSLLYDASRAMFPAYCPEFAEEDAIIADSIDLNLYGKKRRSHFRSGSSTPMQFLRDIGRVGNKITSAFGHMAQDITGKNVFNPESAHSVVVEALEKNRSCEALAKRLWLSFVIEGQDALYREDIIEVLGAGREAEAEECFATLDRDGNGDVSLDEMIMTVSEFSRQRYSLNNSMHDVDQAINVLDRMLCVVILIIIIFIFVAFLNSAFVTTLATAGTVLLSLSFVFMATAQELLGSCIFLFVKHPYDIGDRIDLNTGTDQMVVEHISLLYTVFRRVTNQRFVQIPNIVLNTLWIENVSRSSAMREQISIYVAFDTTLEDVQLLRNEISKFVLDKDNSRDFQRDVVVEVIDLGEMDKLQIQIEICHKSNWANETLRAARRSKFMCGLVLALRKIPIYGPGGGDPALGASGNPSYSVSISDAEAEKKRDAAAKEKESSRLIPTKSYDSKESDALGPVNELRTVTSLNERSPAVDSTRDAGTSRYETNSGLVHGKVLESQELEEVRGMLRRETTKGKRKSSRANEDSDGAQAGASTAPLPRIGITAPGPITTQYQSEQDSFLDEWQQETEREIQEGDEMGQQQQQGWPPRARPPPMQQGPRPPYMSESRRP